MNSHLQGPECCRKQHYYDDTPCHHQTLWFYVYITCFLIITTVIRVYISQIFHSLSNCHSSRWNSHIERVSWSIEILIYNYIKKIFEYKLEVHCRHYIIRLLYSIRAYIMLYYIAISLGLYYIVLYHKLYCILLL